MKNTLLALSFLSLTSLAACGNDSETSGEKSDGKPTVSTGQAASKACFKVCKRVIDLCDVSPDEADCDGSCKEVSELPKDQRELVADMFEECAGKNTCDALETCVGDVRETLDSL